MTMRKRSDEPYLVLVFLMLALLMVGYFSYQEEQDMAAARDSDRAVAVMYGWQK
jgi:hypothetical protein